MSVANLMSSVLRANVVTKIAASACRAVPVVSRILTVLLVSIALNRVSASEKVVVYCVRQMKIAWPARAVKEDLARKSLVVEAHLVSTI